MENTYTYILFLDFTASTSSSNINSEVQKVKQNYAEKVTWKLKNIPKQIQIQNIHFK